MAGLARSVAAAILLFVDDDARLCRQQGHHHSRCFRLDVGADRRQAEARNRPRIAENRAAVGPRRRRDRLHGLWPSRKGQLRRHRTDRAAAGRFGKRHLGRRRQPEISRQDAADRGRQAGGRSAEIHRGQGDRRPHHRRARNLRRRPLRAGQGAGGLRRRFHRRCRRLRPDRRRRQADRLPRRQHRRQIHPGLRREGAAGSAGRNRRRAGAGTRA